LLPDRAASFFKFRGFRAYPMHSQPHAVLDEILREIGCVHHRTSQRDLAEQAHRAGKSPMASFGCPQLPNASPLPGLPPHL
jgi:hypothetical protein